MFEDLFDNSIAFELGVSVETYIEKIESVDIELAGEIINGLLGDDPEKFQEAIRLFNLID